MKCPGCGSDKNIVKSGKRDTRKGIVQRYMCRNCNRTFTDPRSSRAHYPENVILHTLELYNRGYPVGIAKKMTGTRYQYSPPVPTIYSWMKRYEPLLTFIKMRKKYDLDPDDLLTRRRLDHGQVYSFTYHNLKLNIHSKNIPGIRRYINWVERSLDDEMFLKGPRASSTRIENDAKIRPTESPITGLTRLALNSQPKNSSMTAHEMVEEFFLINDSSTVAIELPVFLRPDETDIPIENTMTGHIDMVQVRYNNVWILDYKPNLNDPEKYSSQLLLYREALHKRTSIPRVNIRMGVFNQHAFFEILEA